MYLPKIDIIKIFSEISEKYDDVCKEPISRFDDTIKPDNIIKNCGYGTILYINNTDNIECYIEMNNKYTIHGFSLRIFSNLKHNEDALFKIYAKEKYKKCVDVYGQYDKRCIEISIIDEQNNMILIDSINANENYLFKIVNKVFNYLSKTDENIINVIDFID